MFSYYLGFSQENHEFSEIERFQILPLVFGLLPSQSIFRERYDLKVKPLIISHLKGLGINPDPLFLRILKDISDQYYITGLENGLLQEKYTIEKLKANFPEKYKELINIQNNRCKLCGVKFTGEVIETLDHIIPWRLVGDTSNGKNWQILCSYCNTGKREYFSSLQSKLAYNWVYSRNITLDTDLPSKELRFVILSQKNCCENCHKDSTKVHLFLSKKLITGLAVADNLKVVCENCIC